jgi:hypothetical protein
MKTLLAAVLMVSTAFAQAPSKTVPAQGPPPKNLTVRPDGHVSANQDPANPDQFEVHDVKKGETLSQIAGEVLKNPRLWPQLWEQNEHIINPHWIYPNDKILIRPVTVITEAKPPEPAPEPPAPAPLTEVEVRPPPPPVPEPPPPPPAPAAEPAPVQNTLIIDQRKPTPEVKIEDLYCSGIVRTGPVPNDMKVIGKLNGLTSVLATEADYVYLSKGSEDGIVSGSVYEVIRRTKMLTNPFGRTKAERELGMHYLEVAYIKVAFTQADFAVARVIHSCGDAVEIGDTIIPFEPIELPPRERPRPFNPLMTTSSGIKGEIVATKNVFLSYGSRFTGPNIQPGTGGTGIGLTDRGIASQGTIVYIDIGSDQSVMPGDIFIVYRDVALDRRLYPLPKEVSKLNGQVTAIGELIVVKVGERASTALVTYSTDGLSLGDYVERR